MPASVFIPSLNREVPAHPASRHPSRLSLDGDDMYKRAYAPGIDVGKDIERALKDQEFRASLVIKPRPITRGTITVYEHMVTCKVSQAIQPDWLHGVTRGEVTADFMGKKRKRMLDKMNSWRMPRKHGLFVTMTYPNEYPHDWRRWKADFEKWRRALLRRFPDAQAVWRLELQRRGAPHFHVILYPGERITVVDFAAWNDPVWAGIAHREDQYGGEFACNVRRIQSPGHAVAYAGKYASKYGQAPADADGVILTPVDLGDTLGRQWGTVGKLNCAPYAVVSLALGTLDAVRRQAAVWGDNLGLQWSERLWSIPKFTSWTIYGMGENPTRDTRIPGCDPPPISAMMLQYGQMAYDRGVWHALL